MSGSREGIDTGGAHGRQTPAELGQQLTRLTVNRRRMSFTNGELDVLPLGRLEDPTGDTPAEVWIRGLAALLRQKGYLL